MKTNLLLLTMITAWSAAANMPASAQYLQRNLTGFQKGMGHHTDPNLNGWGMAFSPDGTFCIADTIPGVATFYDLSANPSPP
jgi:hypothetical protein